VKADDDIKSNTRYNSDNNSCAIHSLIQAATTAFHRMRYPLPAKALEAGMFENRSAPTTAGHDAVLAAVTLIVERRLESCPSYSEVPACEFSRLWFWMWLDANPIPRMKRKQR
jgi:hypothetical protein